MTFTDIYHCFETAERSVIVVARMLAPREHRPLRGGFLWGQPVAANRICEACHQIVKNSISLDY